MNDLEWLYALAQAAATFAAIVGAFYTTKVLSISSEKRTVENRIEDLQHELDQASIQIDSLQVDADEIEKEWAAYRIDILEDDFMDKVDVNQPPSLEQTYAIFEKIADRLPSVYEKEAMEKRYPEFIKRINEEAKKKAAEQWKAARRKWLEEELKRGNVSAYYQLQLMETPAYTPLSGYDVLGSGWRRWAKIKIPNTERLRELYSRLTDRRNEVALLEARKAEYGRDLKALAFPRYVREGFLALVYLITVAVAIPLGVARYWSALPDWTASLIFALFISGLLVMMLYLYVEIRDAMKPAMHEPEVSSSESKQGDTAQLERLLREHDVLSSLDAVLLLLLPLTTFVISIAPQLPSLGITGQYAYGFVLIAVLAFIESLRRLIPAKIAGNIPGRVGALVPLVFLVGFGVSFVLIWLTHLVRGGEILVLTGERLVFVVLAGLSFGHALSSLPTKWLAATLKDRIPWKCDTIEAAFNSTFILRLSYQTRKATLIQCVTGLVLLLAFVFL